MYIQCLGTDGMIWVLSSLVQQQQMVWTKHIAMSVYVCMGYTGMGVLKLTSKVPMNSITSALTPA